MQHFGGRLVPAVSRSASSTGAGARLLSTTTTGRAHTLVPRLPIVLCPGLIFWNQLDLKGVGRVEYWGGVPSHLRHRGATVVEAVVPGTGHIRERAAELRRHVDAFLTAHPDVKKVNLVAFSMGGLDARCMIHHLQGHEVVESLTTIATPHRGSSLAKRFIDQGYDRHLARLGIGADAFRCLTPQFVQGLNETTPDHPDVRYYSYAGFKPRNAMSGWGRWAYDRVHEREGANDGFVGVQGAEWGRFLGTVSAAHLELIDWRLGVRHAHRCRVLPDFYDQVLHNLAQLGH